MHIPFSVDMNYCSPSFNLSKRVFIVLHTFIDALDFTEGLGKDSQKLNALTVHVSLTCVKFCVNILVVFSSVYFR